MRPDVIGAEPLHTEVVDKAVVFDAEDICPDLSVANFMLDEAKRYREAITSQCTKAERLKDTLKAANTDFRVPVLAPLLSNDLLCIASMNGHPLRCCAAFVLITRDLELFREFSNAFGDVVDSLHCVNIGLEHGNFEVLGLGLILGRPSIHLHLLSCRVGE